MLISLAKALKLKNRIVGRINKIKSDIQQYNSVLQEQTHQVDVKKLFDLYSELTENLIVLKTNIAIANTELTKDNESIQHKIILLGELKAKLSWLSSLNTRSGIDRHSYQNTEMRFVATFNKNDVDNMCKEIESEIDFIQDELDAYNHTCKIDVSQRMLDLVS